MQSAGAFWGPAPTTVSGNAPHAGEGSQRERAQFVHEPHLLRQEEHFSPAISKPRRRRLRRAWPRLVTMTTKPSRVGERALSEGLAPSPSATWQLAERLEGKDEFCGVAVWVYIREDL